ncbi:MAG: hypothetical protein JWM10_3646 [Myxococcaceae bacterium]|nr:hypothetical protein [Myxococcaceae bacterium]
MTLDADGAFDLRALAVGDVLQMETYVRTIAGHDHDAVAARVVAYLYDALRDGPGGDRALVLARLYRVRRYDALDAATRRFVDGASAAAPTPAMPCLTLAATAGLMPDWNSPATSRGHRAIALPSEEAVLALPMVAGLLAQFGVAPRAVVAPAPAMLRARARHTYNVFHVERAQGSPAIPAQADFVEPFGVRSALGFGGLLADGELFAVVLFSRVPVPRETADLFPILALSVRRALLGSDDRTA